MPIHARLWLQDMHLAGREPCSPDLEPDNILWTIRGVAWSSCVTLGQHLYPTYPGPGLQMRGPPMQRPGSDQHPGRSLGGSLMSGGVTALHRPCETCMAQVTGTLLPAGNGHVIIHQHLRSRGPKV
jgi:hypothetical protein